MNVENIIKKVGYTKLAAELGVHRTAIVNAKRNAVFPAAWFDTIDRLCEERGIECPRKLFNWRSAA